MPALETLRNLGLGGAVGFLVGLALATWVGTEKAGGTILLVVLCIAIAVTAERIITRIRRRPARSRGEQGRNAQAGDGGQPPA